SSRESHKRRDKMQRNKRKALVAAVAALGLSHFTNAANVTWTGLAANGSWSLAGNWTTTVPVANDNLIFAGTNNLSTFNDLTAGQTYGAISFASGAGAFTLAGNGITLANPADAGAGTTTGGGIVNNSANPE